MKLCRPVAAFYRAVAGLDNRAKLALLLAFVWLAFLIGELR